MKPRAKEGGSDEGGEDIQAAVQAYRATLVAGSDCSVSFTGGRLMLHQTTCEMLHHR